MAISKKYSRRIVVDGVAYRWKVPPEVEYDQVAHDGLLIANVWLEEGGGQPLRLLSGVHPGHRAAPPEVVITPRRMADALRAGWQPAVRGSIFLFEFPAASEP